MRSRQRKGKPIKRRRGGEIVGLVAIKVKGWSSKTVPRSKSGTIFADKKKKKVIII